MGTLEPLKVLPPEVQLVDDPAWKCANCRDTGFYQLPADPKLYPRGYVMAKCDCLARAYAQGARAKVEVPAHFADANLALYVPANEEAEAALAACLEFVKYWPSPKYGLCFMGSSGQGKSHLAIATMLACAERAGSVYFCNFVRLLREIKDSYRKEAEEHSSEITRRIMAADLVVLDELGAEKITDWTREAVESIIGELYDNSKLIIATTNYTDDSPRDPFVNLEARVGARIRSRLREMCLTYRFAGKDYRAQEEAMRNAQGRRQERRHG